MRTKLIILITIMIVSFKFIAYGQDLYIPQDYENLKEYYVEMADMYQEQKKDLDDALEVIDEKDNIIKEQTEQIEEISKLLTECNDTYVKSDYRFDIGSTVHYNSNDYRFYISADLGFMLYNNFRISLSVLNNKTYSLGFNYIF